MQFWDESELFFDEEITPEQISELPSCCGVEASNEYFGDVILVAASCCAEEASCFDFFDVSAPRCAVDCIFRFDIVFAFCCCVESAVRSVDGSASCRSVESTGDLKHIGEEFMGRRCCPGGPKVLLGGGSVCCVAPVPLLRALYGGGSTVGCGCLVAMAGGFGGHACEASAPSFCAAGVSDLWSSLAF